MSGGTVALVPIRSLTGGKTRLAGALTPDARAALTRRMLTRVVAAALASRTIETVLVISPDPHALDLAATLDARVVPVSQRSDMPGLNGAIEQGRRWAQGQRAGAYLVLFGDLPLLEADDVENLVRRDAPVVIAPDRHGAGTNALLLRLGRTERDEPDEPDEPDESGEADRAPFRFGFGEGSYAHHVDEAHRLGLEVAVSLTPGTSFDLDTPEDLMTMLGDRSDPADSRLRDLIAAPVHVGVANDAGHWAEGCR